MAETNARAALVTGGSRGIGAAVVGRLARDGFAVAFTYVENADAATAVADAVAAGGGIARPVRADLGQLDDIRRMFDEAESVVGELDVLVNNAAATALPTMIADATEAEYDRMMAINAKGTFFTLQQAATRLRDGGRVVNISTLNTIMPSPGVSIYAASKAAVEQFTAVAARELGVRGITVNTVSPGATETDLLRAANRPEVLERVPDQTTLGRLGRPDDIADVVAFLVGPDGRWVTGQNIRATGGFPDPSAAQLRSMRS